LSVSWRWMSVMTVALRLREMAASARRRWANSTWRVNAGCSDARMKNSQSRLSGSTSDCPPRVSGQQDALGLGGSLRARRVARRRCGDRIPCAQDRIANAPLSLDLVVAREERRVAAHRVEDQPLVGLGRLRQERGLVEELHAHGPQPHER